MDYTVAWLGKFYCTSSSQDYLRGARQQTTTITFCYDNFIQIVQ